MIRGRLFVVFVCLLVVSVNVSHALGYCDDNDGWPCSFQVVNSILTIKGTGAMDDYVFGDTTPWKNHKDETEKIVIGDGITHIGNYAFNSFPYLQSVIIPNTVTSIGDGAFFRSSLPSITLPEGLTTIGASAFSECTNLQSPLIPSNVKTIGASPFAMCTAIESMNLSSDNRYFKVEDGVLFNEDGTQLIQFPAGKKGDYTLPAQKTSIPSSAFKGCSLTSITIEGRVTTIPDSAFANSNNLQSVILPDSVECIGNRSFESCASLESIVLPPKLTMIGDYSFSGCTSLKTISYYGLSAISCGISAFTYCEPELMCVPSGSICGMNVPCNSSCGLFQENKCYERVCNNGVWVRKQTIDAIEWESKSNGCYNYTCTNDGNETVSKTTSATEWESQSNLCFDYACTSDGKQTFRRASTANEWESQSNTCYYYTCTDGKQVYELKNNYTKWEAQTNQCYEYRCIEGVAQSKKRDNATQWEKNTNECTEYQCNNESGFLSWSMCNSSDMVTRSCVDNKCVEKNRDNDGRGRWAVEIEIDELKEVDLNVTEVVKEIALLTGVDKRSINVEVKVDDHGNVVKVIIYIDSEESANIVAERVNGNGASEDCEHGRVLCRAKSAVVYAVETGNISQGHTHAGFIIVFAVLMYELM